MRNQVLHAGFDTGDTLIDRQPGLLERTVTDNQDQHDHPHQTEQALDDTEQQRPRLQPLDPRIGGQALGSADRFGKLHL